MKKSKIIIYAIVGLFALSVLFCIFSLLYSSIERISTGDLNQKLKDFQKKGLEVSEIEASYKKWRNIGKEYDYFKNEFLMTIDDFSKFRIQLQAFFAKYQLRNTQNTLKYKPVFKEFMQVDMIFTVKGTYSNMKQFVHEIKSQKKIIIIRNMDWTKDKGFDEVSGDFIMEVYLVR
jgi:Tfp pilus assembly protein PilO